MLDFGVFTMFPVCSHKFLMVLIVFPNRFSQSSQCVPQDVPNCNTLLSHTLHKLLRCAKGNRLTLCFGKCPMLPKKQMCDGSIKVSQLINTTNK
jgi:hypothetical protein